MSGITNPEFSVEQAPSGNPALIAACDIVPEPEDDGDDVELFTDFMQLLAPVQPLPQNTQAAQGDALFTQIGCDGCQPAFATRSGWPAPAIVRPSTGSSAMAAVAPGAT